MRIQWAIAAIADIDDISRYIRRQNPQAALKVRGRIVAATLSLEQFPEIGRGTMRPGYRLLVVKNLPYVVGYRVFADYIEIASVMDGRMNRSPDIL